MKKLLKSIFLVALALATLSVTAFAEKTEKPKVKVLVLGNSLMLHYPVESLGWTGSWGMAASSADKDYYHVLQRLVKEANPDVDVIFTTGGGVALENAVEEDVDKDYSAVLDSSIKNSLLSSKPDIVIFQFAENAATVSVESMSSAYKQFAAYCEKTVPGVQVVYCTPALQSKSTAKARGIKRAAEETGRPLVDLTSIIGDTLEYRATQYENPGVAGHLNDKGMEVMGTAIAKTVNVLIDKLMNPEQVTVMVDNTFVDCAQYGVLPQIIDNRTMVPLRSIFEALGATVEWNEEARTVVSSMGEDTVEITIGEKKIKKNGEYLANEIDVPAQIVDSRTLVPVRAISEAYNCTVEWNAKTRNVFIKKPEIAESVITEIKNDSCDNFESSGFYGNGNIEIVKDPDDNTNNVIKISAKADGRQYPYVWAKMKFTAGMAYKVSFDARLVSAYNDDKIDSAKLGICFHTKGVDKCVGTAIITADKWTHYAITYTVPDDYMYIVDDDRFGIYGEPVNDTSIVYLVDNITVIPLTEENLEAENKKLEEERIAAVDGLKTVYTINYNNGDDFITENIDELVYGENSATGKAQNADPKFTYKNTLDLNLDNIVALKIKAKIPDGALMQMFFGTSENLTLDEVKKYGIYSLGNYMTTYIIDTTSNPEWKGILKTFRLDPVSSVGQTFEVESVEFLSE